MHYIYLTLVVIVFYYYSLRSYLDNVYSLETRININININKIKEIFVSINDIVTDPSSLGKRHNIIDIIIDQDGVLWYDSHSPLDGNGSFYLLDQRGLLRNTSPIKNMIAKSKETTGTAIWLWKNRKNLAIGSRLPGTKYVRIFLEPIELKFH